MDSVHVSVSVDIVSVNIAGVIGFDESLCEMICCVTELFVEVAIAVLLGLFEEPSVGDKCRSWLLDVSGVESMERGVVSRERGVFEFLDSVERGVVFREGGVFEVLDSVVDTGDEVSEDREGGVFEVLDSVVVTEDGV